jgi:hypothetical protein
MNKNIQRFETKSGTKKALGLSLENPSASKGRPGGQTRESP